MIRILGLELSWYVIAQKVIVVMIVSWLTERYFRKAIRTMTPEKCIALIAVLAGILFLSYRLDQERTAERKERAHEEQASLNFTDISNAPTGKDKAFAELFARADKGDREAQFELGYYYQNREKDFAKAVEWYTKSASQGFAKAQRLLARHYEGGTLSITGKDYDKAIFWYTKLAEKGDRNAAAKVKELRERKRREK